MGISKRFPKKKELASVYAVIVMMVYGWTIFIFNYRLPGWLYFLHSGEIFGIFAYSMVVNMLESLALLLGVITLSVILPQKLFGDAFVARGSVFSILTLGLMMYVANQISNAHYYPDELMHWSPAILTAIVLVSFIIGQVAILRRALEWFADRATIFIYISIPVSLVSLVVVFIRILL